MVLGKQLRDRDTLELCEKFIIHLTKVLISVLDMHPFAFIDFIQPSLEFTTYFLFTSEGCSYLFERFTIQCFNLIKNILLCVEYKPPKVLDMCKHPETLVANEIKIGFFQTNILTDICRKLVSHYFILTQEELEMWDADPETFAIDESGDTWKYSLRVSLYRDKYLIYLIIVVCYSLAWKLFLLRYFTSFGTFWLQFY